MLFFALFQASVSAAMYVTINGLLDREKISFESLNHIPFLQDLTFPIIFMPLFLGGVFLLRGIFDFIANLFVTVVGLKAVRNIRDDIYEHLHFLSLDFFSKGRTGDLMSRTINDVNHVQGAITDVLVDLVKSPATIVFNIFWVYVFGGLPGLLAVVVLPFLAIPVIILGRKVRKFTRRSQESIADVTSIFHEAITGIRVVKSFNQEKAEVGRFKRINHRVFRYLKRQAIATLVQGPIVEIVGGIAAAVGLWFALHHLPPDRFVGYLTTLYVFYEPIKKLGKVNSQIQRAIASGDRIFEIIDTPPSIQSLPSATTFDDQVEEITYENVGFHYLKPDEEGVLFAIKHVNFKVQAGEIIAFVGSSGSGKTTLVNLLPRFYDATSGTIRLNERDIRSITLESLRDKIGIVTQDIVLFNDTVSSNIAYGKPEASPEEIIKAARIAHAHDFILRLEKGYDTVVGEKGIQLSGGQRQRLTIARAILKNPPILILDEATSSLDTESEREVQRAIDESMAGRTVLVIAHRLSTVQNATKIVVMDHGQIIQAGTHEALLNTSGHYKRLYELQFNV